MILRDNAPFAPNYCIVRGASSDREGFVDTGAEITCVDPRVQISVGGVKTLTRFIGGATPEEKAELEARLAELEAENTRLAARVAEADEFEKAVALVKARTKARTAPATPKRTRTRT